MMCPKIRTIIVIKNHNVYLCNYQLAIEMSCQTTWGYGMLSIECKSSIIRPSFEVVKKEWILH